PKPLILWRTRRDSNSRPLPSEGNNTNLLRFAYVVTPLRKPLSLRQYLVCAGLISIASTCVSVLPWCYLEQDSALEAGDGGSEADRIARGAVPRAQPRNLGCGGSRFRGAAPKWCGHVLRADVPHARRPATSSYNWTPRRTMDAGERARGSPPAAGRNRQGRR